ncbi:hypothetical protein MRB53_038860 [Persea americana]|nr:hypothetical protein MRB53_038860 [Persea americana]
MLFDEIWTLLMLSGLQYLQLSQTFNHQLDIHGLVEHIFLPVLQQVRYGQNVVIFGAGKLALLGAVFVFAIASLIAALSININMLVAARALQGAAGGGILILVSVCTSDLFSMRRRALFISLQGAVYAIAGSAGPLIGGAFAQYYTWRWCFWINLPFCGLSFVLLFLMDTHDPKTPLMDGLKAMDWSGIVTMLAMSLLFLLGLEFGGAVFPWNSATVICLIVFGAVSIGAFVWSEKRARYPLMPLKVFTILSNNAVIVLAACHSMVSIGIEYYLPLYFQSVKQESPFKSGLLMLPLIIIEAVTDVVSGVVISKTGRYREVIWVGVVAMTLGTGLYTMLWIDTPISHVIGIEIACGVGVALLFQAPMLAIQNTVKQEEVASASAALGFVRALSTATGVVIGGVVFQGSVGLRKNGSSGNDLLAHAAMNIGKAGDGVLPIYAWSVRNIFIFYACLSGVAVLASLFVKQGVMSEEHEETKTGIAHLASNEIES